VDIDLILAKIGGLKDLLRNQFEAKILWSSVAVQKNSKSKYKKQRVTDNFQITSNCYTLLGTTQMMMMMIHLLTQAGGVNHLSVT